MTVVAEFVADGFGGGGRVAEGQDESACASGQFFQDGGRFGFVAAMRAAGAVEGLQGVNRSSC